MGEKPKQTTTTTNVKQYEFLYSIYRLDALHIFTAH